MTKEKSGVQGVSGYYGNDEIDQSILEGLGLGQ